MVGLSACLLIVFERREYEGLCLEVKEFMCARKGKSLSH